MHIEDVVHYVPTVSSALSSNGRYVVVSTPVYHPELLRRPVQTRVLDLENETPWTVVNGGEGVEAFYAPSIAPDSMRVAGFRYSPAMTDVAIASLLQPELPPISLTGAPLQATALKWRGEPGEVTCVGLDEDGTKRIWVWTDVQNPAVALTPPGHRVSDYAFAPASRKLAWFESPLKTNSGHPETVLLHIGEDHGQDGFTVRVPGTPVGFLAWSPDGTKLAYMGRPPGHRLSRSEVWVLDLDAKNKVSHGLRCITQDHEGWITGFDWLSDGSGVVVGIEQGTYGRILTIPLQGKARFIGPQQTFLSGPKTDRSQGHMLFLRQDGDRPQQLCIKPAQASRPKVLTRFNRRFEQRKRHAAETLQWQGRDGTPIDGIFIEPEGKGPHPTLVWVHGGPAEHINRTFSPYFQSIVAKGWAVFAPNYRGSTGRDSEFLRANIGDLCGEDVQDVLAGIDLLIDQGRIDSEQLAAMGWSYGGSIVLTAAAETTLFKSIVTVAPVVDWVSIFGSKTFPTITREYFSEEIWENRDIYDRCSPVNKAGEINAPCLFLHGALDPRVAPSQSCLMERLLRLRGVETEFHLFPDEFHVFMKPASIIKMLNMVIDWIEKARKPPA